MGMPENQQSGMNIAPDGTVYEILDDGTIKRIGKVSPDGSFEPFGGPQDGIRVRNGFIYRVINGKEQKVGRILPNGEIESISQKIKSEAEISRNKVKIVAIVSVLIAFLAVIYATQARFQTQAEMKMAETEQRRQEEIQRQEEARRQEEMRRKQAQDEAIRLKEELETEKKKVIAVKEEAAKAEAEAKKAEEKRKKQEAEAKKAEEKRNKQAVAAKRAKQEEYLKGRRIGGLIWSDRSSETILDVNDAVNYCKNLHEGSFDDWRLPNIDELRTTIKNCPQTKTGGECKVSERSGCLSFEKCFYPEGSCNCEYRNNGYYSKLGDDGWLWSSSVFSSSPSSRWAVYFNDGDVSNSRRSLSGYVRCVRDAK